MIDISRELTGGLVNDVVTLCLERRMPEDTQRALISSLALRTFGLLVELLSIGVLLAAAGMAAFGSPFVAVPIALAGFVLFAIAHDLVQIGQNLLVREGVLEFIQGVQGVVDAALSRDGASGFSTHSFALGTWLVAPITRCFPIETEV